MASIDVDPFTTAKHARRGHLAGAVLCHASLVVLALTLWGTLMSEVWRADDAMMADADRGPVAGNIVAQRAPSVLRRHSGGPSAERRAP